MRQKRNAIFSALLAIFLGSAAAFSLCADAAMQDEGSNEKLLAAIRDADAQTAMALLSLPSWRADAKARDDDGLTALMVVESGGELGRNRPLQAPNGRTRKRPEGAISP